MKNIKDFEKVKVIRTTNLKTKKQTQILHCFFSQISVNDKGKVSNPTLPAALNSNSGNKGYDLKTKLTICIST